MPHELFEPLPSKLRIRVIVHNLTDRSKNRLVLAVLNTGVAHSFIEEHLARETLQLRPGRQKQFQQYAAPGVATPDITLQMFPMRIVMPNDMPVDTPWPRLYLNNGVDHTIHEAGAVARVPDELDDTKMLIGMDVLRTLNWDYEVHSSKRAEFGLWTPNHDQ